MDATSSEDRYVLLIEDNPADVTIIERILTQGESRIPLEILNTGSEAVDFLFSDDWTDRKLPSLILLDLNLPGTDGRRILERIRSDDLLEGIPVIVLTTSGVREDLEHAYEAGANTYVVKPSGSNEYQNVLDVIKRYWIDVASMPDAP